MNVVASSSSTGAVRPALSPSTVAKRALAAPIKSNVMNAPADVIADHDRVRVLTLRRPKPAYLASATIVNVTSTTKDAWARSLSPFVAGPVPLYGGRSAANVENAWQYCKVFREHVDAKGEPTEAYWRWAEAGWVNPKANRFPMGRGRAPLYSLWDGQRLGYIDARKRIYCPLYARAVEATPEFAKLAEMYADAKKEGRYLALLDHDGWDHVGQHFPLRQVVEAEKPKLGHAFILAGLLEGNRFWE